MGNDIRIAGRIIGPEAPPLVIAELSGNHNHSLQRALTIIEAASLIFRRSIYISEDIPVGGMLTEHNIRIIRPGFGLAPKYYATVQGKRVNCYLRGGTPLRWEYLG